MTTSLSTICKGCWQHMGVPIPIRGPLSIPLRMLGIKISRMNPNLCTICETMFTKVKRRKQIPASATVLFADLRGYTSLSQNAASEDVAEMLHRFTDECAAAIWERDGIVNKFIGDSLLAIFNFPIMRDDHVQQAVLAAQDMQRRWQARHNLVVARGGFSTGLGIGVHTGTASIGEIGTAFADFTIIGPVVNMASRIQQEAKAGEILVSRDVFQHVETMASQARACQFKGFEAPVDVYALNA